MSETHGMVDGSTQDRSNVECGCETEHRTIKKSDEGSGELLELKPTTKPTRVLQCKPTGVTVRSDEDDSSEERMLDDDTTIDPIRDEIHVLLQRKTISEGCMCRRSIRKNKPKPNSCRGSMPHDALCVNAVWI